MMARFLAPILVEGGAFRHSVALRCGRGRAIPLASIRESAQPERTGAERCWHQPCLLLHSTSLTATEIDVNGMPVVAIAVAVLLQAGPTAGSELRVGPTSPAELAAPRPAGRDGRALHPAVSPPNPVVVLSDGTRLWLVEDRVVAQLREGVTVKLSYEERNGHHVVTSIEAAE